MSPDLFLSQIQSNLKALYVQETKKLCLKKFILAIIANTIRVIGLVLSKLFEKAFACKETEQPIILKERTKEDHKPHEWAE